MLSVVYSALRAGTSDFFGGMSSDGETSDFEALHGAETGGGAHALRGGADDAGGSDDEDDNGKAPRPSGPVTYSYSFFHFIFAVASMYLGKAVQVDDIRLTLG